MIGESQIALAKEINEQEKQRTLHYQNSYLPDPR